jgi:hypothetical protein
MRKTVLLGWIASFALSGVAEAGSLAALLGRGGERDVPTAAILVDWQEPEALPPRLRNHCTVEVWSGRSYCEDHCGRGYQVFSCMPGSYGCCRVGHGYCDSAGHLRCHP